MNSTEVAGRPVLLVSYFSGINGCCPAEWADDKIDSLRQLGRRAVLISGIGSRQERAEHVIHYRVPSVSLSDWKIEKNELRQSGQAVPISMYLILPLVLTVGALLDAVQSRLTHGVGGGKWSWLIPAFFVSVFACLRHRCNVVFTTGGPASAHLAGLLAGKVTGRSVVCELQDPLSGNDIGRNARSARLLSWVENLLCRYANKIVYVTETAAAEARERFHSSRIEGIYPGARLFAEVARGGLEAGMSPGPCLRLVHLGTLYSTRNLTTLISAIDKLQDAGQLQPGEIEIDNLGEIYGEIKAHHLSRPYVRQYPIRPRQEALLAASRYDVSLLVQHADDRSHLTIPYKTYDYLNLGNTILALTNNPELNGLLGRFGHFAVDVNDADKIAEVVLKIVRGKEAALQRGQKGTFDAVEQCRRLLSLHAD